MYHFWFLLQTKQVNIFYLLFSSNFYATLVNDWTISIEVEPIDAKGNFSTKTYTTLVRLVANKLKQYQLDVQNDLLRHYDFAKKDCPKLFYGENNPNWEKFKNAVKAAMND